MTLLEKARAVPRKRIVVRQPRFEHSVTQEMIELSLAWVHDELSYSQCSKAMGVCDSTACERIARALRQAVREGKLVKANAIRGWR